MNEIFKRNFACDGEEWVAWVSGTGAYGTGAQGLGSVAALHFARASEPSVPILENLLGVAQLEGLFEVELVDLLRTARRVVDAAQLPESARRKVRTRSLQDHGPPPGTAQDL